MGDITALNSFESRLVVCVCGGGGGGRRVFAKCIWISTAHMDRSIRESPPQFENRIMARVYVRSITRSTMYQKAPFS